MLPPLLEARVMGREGNFQRSLQAYLRSDPAQWASHDLELFSLLAQHGGVRFETLNMLLAALRAGRFKPELRGDLEKLASAAAAADSSPFRDDLQNWLQRNDGSREIAGRVAIRQLEIRRQFLQKEYARLLRDHAASNPTSQPDETVLLLTLSAATQTGTSELDRWSQELKRRYPQPEVQQWLETLRLASN
jgi:hypothetical protein